MPLNKSQLLQWVAAGKTQKAIDEILAYKQAVREDLYAQVVQLAGELSENKRAYQMATLSTDVLQAQRNRINESLIQIINELDKPAPVLVNSTEEQPSIDQSGVHTGEAQTQSQMEQLVETVAYVLSQMVKRPWKYKSIHLIVLLIVFLNPLVVKNGLKAVGWPIDWINDQYGFYFWLITGLLFILAVMLAVRAVLKSGSAVTNIEYAKNSPIKGLRSFDFEDASIFRQLQRNEAIDTCFQGLNEKTYRFGVLTGESGAGKTSFLRAGLHPELNDEQRICVVVKLSNEAPMRSIQETLKVQLDVTAEPGVGLSLKQLLDYYLGICQKEELVLIIDQFEQFFTQQKTIESRKPFIEALLDCYQHAPKVKILVSLRKDFQGYLYEIQDVLGYSLTTRRNYFDLKKFSPIQATEIFKVMAAAESLEFDTSFVYNMCKEELASKEDGLISAVDVQILAFIIKGQQLEDKAFTRSAFQKMGGIEGLLQRFLEEQFEAPNRYNQDKAALKVLLAFIDLDHNVRSGDMTVEKLLPRIDKTVNPSDVKAILQWLENLRLITKTELKDRTPRYELAHERLILPLRNLAGKTLSQMDQANIILERRTNEWLANEQKSRFLLTWGEYRNIIKHQKLVTWGKNEAAKRSLLQASKRKFQWRVGIVATLLIIGLCGWFFNRQNTAVINLINEAEKDIIGLEYDSATFKLHAAGQKGLKKRRVAQKLLEVAFYYNEIGASERAAKLMQDTILKISGNGNVSELLQIEGLEQKQAWGNIDQAIQTIDQAFYEDSLITRYFPVMETVKGGTYQMGYLKNDQPEGSARVVTLSDFRMAKTETTIWQYQLFTKATNTLDTLRKPDDDNWVWIGNTPAIYVSWYDAIAYANWVSDRLGFDKVYQIPDSLSTDPHDWTSANINWDSIPNWQANGFRLPTEAEWEFAARGGIKQDTFIYSGSPDLDSVGWSNNNSAENYPGNRTNPVGKKKGNSVGLYDMSGNVWEWCWNWYSPYENEVVENPRGPAEGRSRVLRGGSWNYYDYNCTVSFRNYDSPGFRNVFYGFRLSQGFTP